jgi:hypothetical protein
MAKITLDLNQFKASGVYTIEFDASERIVVTTQTIRLVVGFSRKGPFNAPVFLRDVGTSRRVFGGVDAFLEKRGSFFHRSIETCLQTAPVFGLNLLPLNNIPVNEGGDAVDYRSFALAANEQNGDLTRALISSFYNKERFWFPDTSYLQATVDSKPANRGRLFNFVNLGQEVQSIIIRKSDNANQYNVTAESYYGRGNVPAFINPKDFLSDYFVDIYVVKGDWTNLAALSQDPVYSKYFDLRGVIVENFFTFLSLDAVTLTGSFTGTIIPDFVDNNGSNQSIDTIVNSAVAITGIFCNLNKEEFDDYENSTYKVDPVGNTLINTTDDIIDFLSYNTPIKSILTYASDKPVSGGNPGDGFEPTVQETDPLVSPIVYVKSYPFGGVRGNFNNVLVIPKPYPSDTTFTVAQYDALTANLNNNSLVKTFGTDNINDSSQPNNFVKIHNIVDTGSELQIQLSSPLHTDDTYENTSGDYAESNYILESDAFAVPSVADTIVINNPTGAGDSVLTVTSATTAGQPLATVSAWTGGTGAIAAVATYTALPVLATGGGTGAVASVTTDVTGAITGIVITTPGSGYKPASTITIASGWDGATATAITITTRTYVALTSSAYNVTGGSGNGAILTIACNSAGTVTTTVTAGGSGYTVGNTLTAVTSQGNYTYTIATISAGPSITPGDILLIQAPGYNKYFEIDTVTVGATTTTITVLNTGLTTGGPWYLNKYCVEGFPSDEFASYLQPTDIKVKIFDISEADAVNLVPDITLGTGDGFGYIANVDVIYSKIEGLGQVETPASVNEVALYNVTTDAAIAGTWYILGDATNLPYDINGSVGNIGDVRIVGAGSTYTQNAFDNETVGDVIKVTLPSGDVFYGEVTSASATTALGSFNLGASGTLRSIASFALYEAYPASNLSKNIAGNLVVDGDRIKYSSSSSTFNYLNITNLWNRDKDAYTKIAYGLFGSKVAQYTTDALLNRADSTFADVNYTYNGTTIYTDGSGVTNDVAIYSSLAKDISELIEIEAPGLYGGGKKFKLTTTNAAKLEIGDYVVNNDIANPILIRVTGKVKKLDNSTGLPYFEYTVLDTPGITVVSGINKITKFAPIQKFCDRYQFTKLGGFTLTDYHLPGTPAQLEKIYGVLENTNLAKTLADKDVISFRYIVDTFNGGLEPHMGPKQVLSRLAKNRQKCMALLNAPSIAEFQASTDPRFTELPDPAAGNPKPVLNTTYIAEGGNLSLGPSYIWGLPDEDQGAKFIGVFSPNIIIRENNKDVSIPPAADVSNNFIRKFINGEPFGIVAGPRRGVISNPKFVKMEYDYLLDDRENLEPVGINPIVVVKNVGPMIYANQSAYQRTLSAFNNLHVRDLLITIEEAVEEILQNYLFQFNDASTRLEIRSIVETYLDTVRNAGGVYAYEVIMDDTNNTPAIIDQNFGIIDIGIEPARGIQKFINRITVLKTGAINSGGFAAV